MLTVQPYSFINTAQQASKVAPVVSTSSTNKICRPVSSAFLFFAEETEKAFSTFFHREFRSLSVCVGVNRFLFRQRVSTRPPVMAAMPRAIISDWLNPLFLFFLGCSGTGTIASGGTKSGSSFILYPNIRPRRSPNGRRDPYFTAWTSFLYLF